MEELCYFYAQNGLWLTLIAIAGIVILGVMKYCNLFNKLKEDSRHYLYVAISIFLSIIGGAIYLLCTGNFDKGILGTYATCVFSINQTFYNLFKTFSITDLCKKALDKIFNWHRE